MAYMWKAQSSAVFADNTGLTSLDCTTSLSLGFWRKNENYNINNNDDILWTVSTQWFNGIALAIANGQLSLRMCNAAGIIAEYTSTFTEISRGLWVHYAISWNGAELMMYRNGELGYRVAHSAPITTSGGIFKIGRSGQLGANGCKMFDLQFYPSVSLSSAEIRAMMNPLHLNVGCKGRWMYQSVNQTGVLRDESGNSNNLNLGGTGRGFSCENPPIKPTLG